MIKIGKMRVGIRKPRRMQLTMHWGDCFVDGWPPFYKWNPLFTEGFGVWDGVKIHVAGEYHGDK